MLTLQKKICLLGDFAVGKTSLVRRFIYNRFDDKYISTIGVKVSRKTVAIPRANDIVNLTIMLWDLAGSEEFSHMRASYLRGAAGAVLVCDMTRAETLENLQVYIDDLVQLTPNAHFVLAANKNDLLAQHQVSPHEIEQFAKKYNISYRLTSAKTGEEVDTLFRYMGNMLVK
ncbi:MAG: GTP-binding protein [Anaerolineae bacterium]|nr:GTP-binding protein [Anaerolineae bacterium]